MILELAEALDYIRGLGRIRITTDEGNSWQSQAPVVTNDAIIVDEEGKVGVYKIGNLRLADFRRMPGGIDILWPSGAMVQLRGLDQPPSPSVALGPK